VFFIVTLKVPYFSRNFESLSALNSPDFLLYACGLI